MYSSIILLERSRTLLHHHHHLLHNLTILRRMGGGPRTFPGGLNKWQWKRLHEKQARQKEKRLLDQEKELYQARVRSEIRSNLDSSEFNHQQQSMNSPNFKPLSPKEHIKALADRFMKDGAEDLWNEADGPIRSVSRQEMARIEANHRPIDIRRIASNETGEASSGFSYTQLKPRRFSTYSCSDKIESNIDMWRVISGGNRVVSNESGEVSSGFSYTQLKPRRFSTYSCSDKIESNPGPIDIRRVISAGNGIASNESGEVYSGFSYSQLKPRQFSSYSCSDKIELNHTRVISGGSRIASNESGEVSSGFSYNQLKPRRFSTYLYLDKIESNHGSIDILRAISGGDRTMSNKSGELSSSFSGFSYSQLKPRQFSSYSCSDKIELNHTRVISGGNRIVSNGSGEVSSGFSYNQLKPWCFWTYSCSDKQYSLLKARHYSARGSRSSYRKNDSSASEDDGTDNDEGFMMMKSNVGGRRGGRLSLIGSSDGEGTEDDDDGKKKKKMMMSSAALGKYDTKKTKRIPLKFLEDEDDLSLHVQAIRNEFNKRRMAEKDSEVGDDDSILSPKRFDECNVSPLTIKALTLAGYVQMTKVQDATLSACLEGKDALVKAKTGTGKTVAFLLPAIETVLKASIKDAAKRVPQICVLILLPTRELASQIAAEANVLLKYHDGIGVQTLVGGTRFKDDQRRLETEPCQIIVATPGRLLDHIENKSGFSARLMGLKMLILDEADHLLDLGFRKDIEKIVDCLPRQKQSLLFSSTLPKEVRRVSQLVLKREHAYINTVGLGPETHDKVNQSYVIAPHEQHFQIVHHLLKEHIAQVPNYKVIVFCTTAMMTSLMFSLLREMKMRVREIHSRKPQLYRTRVSDEFKEARQLILITSEVSARGMNYPDVSLVIQVGVPTDRGQYINRLGRTGREGKGGEGIMLLAPWEEYFLEEIKDLPLSKSSSPHLDPDTKVKIEKSMAAIDPSVKEAAYHAWLGYYNSIRETGRDKTTLAELATGFCKSIGLEKVPALFRKTAVKMGLKDIAGIRIRK